MKTLAQTLARLPSSLRFISVTSYQNDAAQRWTRGWHAPRMNRWERMTISRGEAVLNILTPATVYQKLAPAEAVYWLKPGTRWCLSSLVPGTAITLTRYADAGVAARSPQNDRSAWLQNTGCDTVKSHTELAAFVRSLRPGTWRYCHGKFAWQPKTPSILGEDPLLSWHWLKVTESRSFVALAIRCTGPASLLDYLARDHLLLEAKLSMASMGSETAWSHFKQLLSRHMSIEENVLFPRCGRELPKSTTVEDLVQEHQLLRKALGSSDRRPGNLQRVWRLLEAHDEKEELLVYPKFTEIMANISPSAFSDPFIHSTGRGA